MNSFQENVWIIFYGKNNKKKKSTKASGFRKENAFIN